MRIRLRNRLSSTLSILFFPIVIFSQSSGPIDSLINQDALKQIVEFLAADSLKGRFTGSNGAAIAARYIADEFRRAGAVPLNSSTDYLIPFQSVWINEVGHNVVAKLPGTDPSAGAVIFSAHYDHIGTASTNPNREFRKKELKQLKDTIYNGANDNASGTSALICLARYYGHLKNNRRTIIFIAFSGEELGLVGSSAMAASIENPGSVACMINLEMLGRGSSPFITGSELGNTRNLLNAELARIDAGRFKKQYFKRERYPEQMLFKRSDNFPFAQLRIPAHTVMAGSDQDPYYHSFKDEPSTLNYVLIQQITQALALAMKPIIDGNSSPSRIDASNYSAN